MNEIWVYNVRIDNVTMGEAVARALQVKGKPCFVVTPNAVMLDNCRRNPARAALLNRATLSLPDGMGVLWAARRRAIPLKERVAGIAFGEVLLSRAAEEGLGVFLLGGRDGVAEKAAANLRLRDPRLRICGTHHGYFEKHGAEDERVIERIRAARPDVLFVCFGFPAQEEWIAEHLSLLSDVRVIAGLGGSLDVWAGNLRRAPAWVTRMGLEWAWRMVREPKRLRHLPALVRVGLLDAYSCRRNCQGGEKMREKQTNKGKSGGRNPK